MLSENSDVFRLINSVIFAEYLIHLSVLGFSLESRQVFSETGFGRIVLAETGILQFVVLVASGCFLENIFNT